MIKQGWMTRSRLILTGAAVLVAGAGVVVTIVLTGDEIAVPDYRGFRDAVTENHPGLGALDLNQARQIADSTCAAMDLVPDLPPAELAERYSDRTPVFEEAAKYVCPR